MVCALVLCTVLAAETFADGPTELPPLRFAWPVPCRVQVREDRQFGCSVISAQYTLCLSPSGDGRELELSIAHVTPLTPERAEDGSVVTVPESTAWLEFTRVCFEARPKMRVALDGRVLGVVGAAEGARRLLASMEQAGQAEAKSDDYRRREEDELARMLELKVREIWCWVVGDWVGVTMRQGVPLVSDLPGPPSITPAAQVHRTAIFRGLDSEGRNLANLESISVLPAAARALHGQEREVPADRCPGRVEFHLSLLTDPRTLQPERVSWRVSHPECHHMNSSSVESCRLEFRW